MSSPIGSPSSALTSITSDFNQFVGTRVAVVGDSMSAQNYLMDEAWPSALERVLNQNGVPCQIRTFAVNAHSYFRANNTAVFGTNTVVDEVIEYQPEYIICLLGVNDTLDPIDSRSLVQVQADADTFYSDLKTGLPSCTIYYVTQVPYDRTNWGRSDFVAETVKNKGVAPAHQNLNSSGILQDLYTSEILENTVSTTKQAEYVNFIDLDTHVKSISDVDDDFDIEAWRAARLGLLLPDLYHFNNAGHKLLAGSVLDGLIGISSPLVADLSDQLIEAWTSFDSLWADYMTDSGDGWTYSLPSNTTDISTDEMLGSRFKPDSWFMPYKAVFKISTTTVENSKVSAGSIFNWTIFDAQPNTTVENSVAGGAFSSSGVSTDENGFATDLNVTGPIGLPDGAYVFRFKVGDQVFAPVTLTVTSEPAELNTFTVATLPTASSFEGGIITVSDETGGYTLAFSDGTNWRRAQDRAIVS